MTAVGIWFIVASWFGTRLSRSEFWEVCWGGVFLAGILLIAASISMWAWEMLP